MSKLPTLSLKIFLFLLLNQACLVHGLIPEQCGHNLTLGIPICCPVSHDTNEVCGGPRRGECIQVWTPKEPVPSVFLIDDRIDWPNRYFTHFCQCKDNYFGAACDECWFGWIGKHCNQRHYKVRRDIRTLSEKDLDIFKSLVLHSQHWPSGYLLVDESDNWNVDPLRKPKLIPASIQHYLTYLHQYGSRSTLYKNVKDCEEYGILNFNHDGIIFPTWHRYSLLLWERFYARMAKVLYGLEDYAAPYWDWIGKDHCDICNDKYIGGPGHRDEYGVHLSQGSPFHNLTEFCYEPYKDKLCTGCQFTDDRPTITRQFTVTDFPDRRDLEFVLGKKQFFVAGERESNRCDSFHMALEGYCGRPGADPNYRWFHNKMHVMIDGSMCCAATSTNDPIFLLHHTFIDKVFECWLRLRKPKPEDYPDKGVRPGHSRYSFTAGIIPLARNIDFFNSLIYFGVTYDNNWFGTFSDDGRPPYYCP
ncbi:unnamed protein product [Trichobilharzia szidati]|nr:unnamed protein product [Trichobilharzia szidati]